MKRLCFLSSIFTLIFAGGAFAQVATTDLLPGQGNFIAPQAVGITGTTFTTQNPAALAWSLHSSAGVGAFKGETDAQGQTYIRHGDIKGNLAGLRAVGSTFGVALGYLKSKGEGGDQFDSTDTNLQLSANLGGWLGLGIGTANTKVDAIDTSGGTPTPISYKIKSNIGGASLNLGDWFFVGAAKAKETFERPDPMTGNTVSESRDSNRAGVGVRTKGTWSWYAEYYLVDNKAFPSAPDSGFKAKTATAQVKYESFLVGASATKIDIPVSPTRPSNDLKVTTVDVAWAPDHGLAIGLRAIRFKEDGIELDQSTMTLGPFTSKTDTNFVTVSWVF